MKKLNSGLEVDETKYYQLLEWKDNNMSKYEWFLRENGLPLLGINSLNEQLYNLLLEIANI